MTKKTILDTRLQTLAIKAADLLLPYPWKIWFWGDSVGFEGLLDASEITGYAKYLVFAYGVFKSWLARERCRSEFDYNAPGVALLRVWEKTHDTSLLAAARRHADYLAEFRQTESGAFMRYENSAMELPAELPSGHPEASAVRSPQGGVENGGPCIFVDSVHVEAPFFAKLYAATGEETYRRLAVQSISSQIELLFDPGKELFHHFWMERTKSRNGIAWGRGNCWGLMGLVETLENLPHEDPGCEPLHQILRTVITRMIQLQDSEGGWHTVVDDNSSYIETSIAAFMVSILSRSIMHRWIDPDRFAPVVELAMTFALDHVSEDGLLKGVSYETFPSTRIEHYRTMPRGGVIPWGQGPLLAALKSYKLWQDNMQFSGKNMGRI